MVRITTRVKGQKVGREEHLYPERAHGDVQRGIVGEVRSQVGPGQLAPLVKGQQGVHRLLLCVSHGGVQRSPPQVVCTESYRPCNGRRWGLEG